MPSRWGEERTEAHADVVAALISFYRELEPDFLCLQEVPSPETCDKVAVELGMRGHYAQGGGRPAYGGALLWRAHDGVFDDLTHTRVRDERIFERICLVLRAKVNGEPLVIANLHLSSNRFAPDCCGGRTRLNELEALFRACSPPDIVAGDFNARPDSAEYVAMIERGYVDCGSLLSANRCQADERIDYIWVREDSAVRAEDVAGIPDRPFTLAGKSSVDLSDHPVVGARLTW